MKKISIFSLMQHSGEYHTWPLKTQLLQHQQPTPCYLSGYQLLHQFQLESGDYLFITDWDCPFEEATEVLLLDANLMLIASHTFSAPYGAFNLEDLQVMDAANLKLTFYDNDCRQVTVLDEKIGLMGSRIQVAQLK